ncbi:MAG: sugar phosphate isomerase/epimerase [Clostridiaceae bacterium]|jgi:sugar phosphate isomerase/epimerase|nr:sugar phosphate isomerase/epimerase [Clostridiaceae bacterium]
MKLGLCTTDFAQAQPVEHLFDRIRQAGYVQVQFNFAAIGSEDMPASVSASLIRRIRQAAADNGLEMVAINATFNLIDPDQDRLRENMRRFPVIAAASRDLGCPTLTLCTGTHDPHDMWRYHPDNALETSFQALCAAMEQLLPAAETNQLFLGIETEAANVAATPERARRLLDTLGSSRVKIIMDGANVFQPGQAQPGQVPAVLRHAFDRLGKDVILAHGKDIAASAGIRFATPGRGILDYDLFLTLLEQAGYTGGMILHGIQDEADIPVCADWMKETIRRHRSSIR